MRRKYTVFIFLLASAMYACSKSSGGDNEQDDPVSLDCTTINSSFSEVVFPIINLNCATSAGCHGPGSVQGPGELTNYTQIKANASAVKNAVLSEEMPPGAPLSINDQNAISCWVSAGAPNN